MDLACRAPPSNDIEARASAVQGRGPNPTRQGASRKRNTGSYESGRASKEARRSSSQSAMRDRDDDGRLGTGALVSLRASETESVLDGAVSPRGQCPKGHALDEPSRCLRAPLPPGRRSEKRVSGAAGHAANDDRAVTRRRQRSTGFSALEQCSHRRTRVLRDRSGRGEALRSARSVVATPEDRICQSRRRPSGRRRCQLQTHIADGE